MYETYRKKEAAPPAGGATGGFEEAARCHICEKAFGVFTWRHHCRACKRSVCDAHSERKLAGERACDYCMAEAGEGLVVLGFPCNQFAGQEPGPAAQIKAFVHQLPVPVGYKAPAGYGVAVTFPMFGKVKVNGPNADPLFKWLRAQAGDGADVNWNFAKFVVGRDGQVVGRFDNKVLNPFSNFSAVEEAVRVALAAP